MKEPKDKKPNSYKTYYNDEFRYDDIGCPNVVWLNTWELEDNGYCDSQWVR